MAQQGHRWPPIVIGTLPESVSKFAPLNHVTSTLDSVENVVGSTCSKTSGS
jgi:hypothetical protein